MTLKEIVDGLQFTLDMFLFDPTTGETYPEPRNDMDKITIDACKGAIELLEQQPCEDCINREDAINVVHKYFVNYLKLNDDICLDGIRSLPSVKPQPNCGADMREVEELLTGEETEGSEEDGDTECTMSRMCSTEETQRMA